MSEFVSVIFCRRCGSRYVEIRNWEGRIPIAHCRSCGNKTELNGFTLGRCQVTRRELGFARNTAAGLNDFEK